MNAVVVYESMWGNTAEIARAIADGIGPGARALRTDEATPEQLDGVDLLLVGAPVLGFTLPTEQMHDGIRSNSANPTPTESVHPAVRTWLESAPKQNAAFSAFETRAKGPWPGSSIKHIGTALSALGYRELSPGEPFRVAGKFGPLVEGEADRARAWGRSLAAQMPTGAQ